MKNIYRFGILFPAVPVIVSLFFIAACGGISVNDKSFSVPKTPPVGITSPYSNVNWDTYGQYKAALHVHSTRSDGANTFSDMIENHYARGYDILAMTDHNVLNRDWTSGENALTEERYNEIAAGTDRGGRGMVCLPLTDEQSYAEHVNTFFADFNNEPSATQRGTISKAGQLGGISHINHPGMYTGNNGGNAVYIKKYVKLFMDFPSCTGIEIVNQKDRFPNDRIMWDNILKETIPRGRNVWGYSNDDTHNKDIQTGYSFDILLMPANNPENIKAAMKGGNFYAVAKVAKNELGDVFTGASPVPIIRKITVNESGLRITIIAQNAVKTVWIADGSEIYEGDTYIIGDHPNSFYVRADVIGSGGVAFTQPFIIRY